MTDRVTSILILVCSACMAGELPSVKDMTPCLVQAIADRNTERVAQLLAMGVPPSAVSAEGDTPLCAALRLGLTDIAAELLQHGADASACGPDGQMPLALASLRRCPSLMKTLLAAGANPNILLASPATPAILDLVTDGDLRLRLNRERKITPLMVCAARGDVEAVTLLLKAGANTEARTLPNRLDALDFAAEKDYLFVMRLLLGRNPDSEPQVLVTVNLTRQRAVLQVEGDKKLETSVSTGRAGFATPEGRYVITQKYKQWNSTIYKVPMPFFMRLNSGNFGLHSGYVTGSPASHGCVRLPDSMARKFFDIVQVGDEVLIER